MPVHILRIGHRVGRDPRISTHCGLVSRALGARKIIYSGEPDEKLLESIRSVAESWGGPFSVEYNKSWKAVVSAHKKRGFSVVHLTMYGLPIQSKIGQIRKKQKVLVVIGSEKVPGEVYRSADYNLSVASQPHSEVAALAIFLHEYFRGNELSKKFSKAKIKIIPQAFGKKVMEKK